MDLRPIALSLALAFAIAIPAHAQRFSKELELLDPDSLKYSEKDVKEILANISGNAKSALERADWRLKEVNDLLAKPGSDQQLVSLRADCNDAVRGLNMLIVILPSLDELNAGADKRKVNHLQQLLFAARDELMRAKSRLDMRIAGR